MTHETAREELVQVYNTYLTAVNQQDWARLSRCVESTIRYNGTNYDFEGYCQLIPPAAQYSIIETVIDSNSRRVAVRLNKKVGDAQELEHCFYHFSKALKINEAFSMTAPSASDSAVITYESISDHYKRYIETLNKEDWGSFPRHLADTVNHNGNLLDHAGYRQLIPPQTHFTIIELLVDVAKRQIGVRLAITVGDKKVTEHVFYHFTEDLKIDRVWSLVQDGQVTG